MHNLTPGPERIASVTSVAASLNKRIRNSFPDAPIIFVANPAAGTERLHRKALKDSADLVATNVDNGFDIRWTEYPNHAGVIGKMLKEAGEGTEIVVSIGGDGTHYELLSGYVSGNGTGGVRAFVRVPFGSGNDGAEAPDLPALLRSYDTILTTGTDPVIEIQTMRRKLYGFNIASLGVDAFIIAAREKFRDILPGSSYRIVADVAVLFYERIVELREMTFTTDADKWTQDAMLVAFGAGGGRTYGGHMHVLPGKENLCVINRGGLAAKLKMKKLFYQGKHVDQPLTRMIETESVTVEYQGALHMQIDGEPVSLDPEEFPVTFKRKHNAVPVVVPARIADQIS